MRSVVVAEALHDETLSDLELQAIGARACRLERRLDGRQHAGVGQLGLRQVDRDPKRLAAITPGARLPARLAQHPGIEGEAQAAGISDRDELAGGQEPALGVTPAHQSLDAGAAIGRKIELWLIVEFELVAFERAAHLPLELLAPLHFGIEIPGRRT